ncbi:homeobox-leucine zipper protein ATHB-12-like [Pyrus ussuriensis x Pyrus communis]|uniref:Homeobox-leucine zipper protein n=1 Tax=Pyrus ussuriensis x Pyrus communis TaxID=2448454 RepID=A0A5N5F9G7_9ROSA|nr:homeobox-leucine zipper protein ATHB-12-like [Pyrus ussuriensis x Pyrus communis]
MLDKIEYSSPSAEDHETFSCMSPLGAATTRRKNNKNNKRFSDEQIRSLESIFESESRLEPRKKMQLAKELGLQPKQVAIWFQNKRARWKSKQLERDYSKLRANYNNLASKFEALKKEKQALVVQVQKLNNLMMMQRENCGEDVVMNNGIDGESDNGDATISESDKVKLDFSGEKSEQGGLGVLSDDDSRIKAEYFGLEDEPNLANLVESADGSLTSAEDWGKLNSDGLFDVTSGDYQWWDFWS